MDSGLRQYGRNDIEYESWYSDWMKRLAKLHTVEELESMLYGKQKEVARAAESHRKAVERSTSMSGNCMARAHARNSVAASGEAAIAIRGALEIYELFPENTKEG